MKFSETPIPGVYLIDLEKRGDERGFFARVFCINEFQELGLTTQFVQVNNSLTSLKGTLRGMHYQLRPKAEAKLVRCIRGALWDCALDLRPESATFGKSFGAELSAENRRMMYIPKGFAHGFVTLADDTEAFYFVDEFYAPDLERGIRWNDPRFGIEWPIEPTTISDKDRNLPDFDPVCHFGGPAGGIRVSWESSSRPGDRSRGSGSPKNWRRRAMSWLWPFYALPATTRVFRGSASRR